MIVTRAACCYRAICAITLGWVCYSVGTKFNMRMLSVFTLQMKVCVSGMQMNNSHRALMGVRVEDNNFVLWYVSVHACGTKSWIVSRKGSKWPKRRHSFTGWQSLQRLRTSGEIWHMLGERNMWQMSGKNLICGKCVSYITLTGITHRVCYYFGLKWPIKVHFFSYTINN